MTRRSICELRSDPAFQALVEGLVDKLGVKAEWEAVRDYLEHHNTIRTPSEVLNKISQDTMFNPYWKLIEESTLQPTPEIKDMPGSDYRKFMKLVGMSKREVSGLQKAMFNSRVKKANGKLGTSFYITYDQVGQADLWRWKIKDMGAGGRIVYNINFEGGYLTKINNKFNQDLEDYLKGKIKPEKRLPEGYVFQLGKPTRILEAAGLPDLPITMSVEHFENKIMKDHGYEMQPLDLHGLPFAIHNPLMIMEDKDHANRLFIVTSLQNEAGNNIDVFVEAERALGRGGIKVNSVTTIFPRTSMEGLIKNILKDKLLFVNKRKALDYIGGRKTPSLLPAVIEGNTNIQNAVDIIKGFQNKISDATIYNLERTENQDPSVSSLALELSGFDASLSVQETDNVRATEITQKLADKLTSQLNTPYQIVSLQEAQTIHDQIGKPLPTGAQAFYVGDTVYFVDQYLSTKNVFHEFSHPLVRAVFVSNRPLFDKIYSDILSTPEGADVAEYVRNNYGLDESDPLFKEEIVVRALTEAAMKKQDQIATSTGFKKAIDNLLYAIKQLLRKVFGQKVDVSKLDVNTTLNQLSDMLTKGENFKIETEVVNQDDAVAYLKDQQKYVKELSQSPYRAELQDLTNKFFTAVQYGVKHAKDVKDYDALLDFVSNEFKSGEVDKMRKDLAKYQTLILDKTSEKLGTLAFDQERVNALIDSLTHLHTLTGKIFTQLLDLTKDLSQDNMAKIEYYKNVLNHWEEFINEAENNLTTKVPADSSLAQLLGGIKQNLSSSNNMLNRTYESVALEAIWKPMESTAANMQEQFDQRMKDLNTKLSKANPSTRESIEKQIEKEKREFQEQLPTKAKVLQALKGELKDSKGQIKDAPWLTSFVEAYAYNPDPVVGGLANFFKDNMTDMQAKAYHQANEFANEMKPLLEKIGYNPNNEGKLGRDIGQEEEVGEVDKDGNFVKKKVWRFLNQFTGADVVRQEYIHKIQKARDKFLETNTEEDRIALRDIQAEWRKHKRDFWHDKYTPEFHAVWDLLERDDIGKEAAGLIEEIYDEIDLLEMPTNALDELEKSDRVEALLRKLRRLADSRDDAGRMKTGNDLLLAERIREFNEKSKELYDLTEVPNAFELALSSYEQKLIDEGKQRGSNAFNTLRQQWLDKNTRVVVKPEFYEARQEIIDRIKVLQSYLPENQKIQIDITAAWEEILAITKGYRDQDGQPVGSEMSVDRVKRVKELLKKIDEAREELRTLSGLTKEEEGELQELFLRAMEGTSTSADRTRISVLMDRKSALRLNRFQRAELTRLYAELSELQKKEPTDYYVDTVNAWLSGLDTIKLHDAFNTNSITKSTANLLLNDSLLDDLFEQSPEFEKWFKANHVRKEVYDKQTLETVERWERIYVWNVVRPQDDAYYETTIITNGDGIQEKIKGLPSLKYYKRLVKPEYKTKEVVGETVDNRGNWLPKTTAAGAADDRYENKAYYNLQKNNPDLFAVLEKMKEYHLRHQEGLHRSAKLWMDMPRFRKQSIERLQSKNLWQRLLQRIRDFFTKVKDGYDSGLNPVEGEFTVAQWDQFDSEHTGLPISGVSSLDFEEVSTDIAYTMMRYMLSAERNKKLMEISPAVRAIQRIVNNNHPVLQKALTNRNILINKGKKDKYIRAQAVNNFIQREFEGQTNAGLLADNQFAQNLSNTLFKTASFSYLALNIPSALKNSISMKFQGLIEGAAGKYMTAQGFLKAEGVATQAMFEITKQVYEPGSKSLNVQLVDAFDMESGRTESKIGEGLTRTVGKDTMKVVERMTDFRKWVQLQASLQTGFAMLDHIKVPQNDKLISYKDAWEVKDGRLQLKEGVPAEYGITYNTEGEQIVGEKFKQYKKRMSTVAANLNGAMGKADSAEADRHLLFRYISFFRRFFTAMFANRFAKNRVNYGLGETKEGYYITMLKLTKKTLQSMGKYLPYASPDEKRALMRFSTELGTLILMSALLPLLFDYDRDDKDRFAKLREKKGFGGWISNHALLLMMQIRSENEQFIPAPGFGLDDLSEYLGAKSLVMGPTINSMVKVADDLRYAVTGDDRLYYKRDSGPYFWQEEGSAKVWNHLFKAVGITGTSVDPVLAIRNYEALQARGR